MNPAQMRWERRTGRDWWKHTYWAHEEFRCYVGKLQPAHVIVTCRFSPVFAGSWNQHLADHARMAVHFGLSPVAAPCDLNVHVVEGFSRPMTQWFRRNAGDTFGTRAAVEILLAHDRETFDLIAQVVHDR